MSQSSTQRTENGIPVGTWNKYQSRNPIQRYLVRNFLDTIAAMLGPLRGRIASAIDLGCGEGHVTRIVADSVKCPVVGTDFSAALVAEAAEAYPDLTFRQADIYAVDTNAELITACEVLEHLEEPERALTRIAACRPKFVLLSVPNEPLFRSLNFLAGKYVARLGNAPGHLQHWSSSAFSRLVARHFEIVEVRRPLPWTAVLAKPR